MKMTTLEDMQQALDEAFPWQFQIMNSPGPDLTTESGAWLAESTTREQRQRITIPAHIAKKYLHCNGCNECQGEEPVAPFVEATAPRWRLINTWNGGAGGRVVSFESTLGGSDGENECFRWVHNNTPFSFYEAVTNQGFLLEPIPET